jgi:hypothetical protein
LYPWDEIANLATHGINNLQNGWRVQNNPQKGEIEMGHSGKKDKGQKEEKKKSKHTLKEKRKLKQEKNQQTEKKHITIPG